MLVFNIKLRSNTTSINSRACTAIRTLLIRSVETRNFRSLQTGQKGVYLEKPIKILSCRKLWSANRVNPKSQEQLRQALKVKNLRFFGSTTYLW
jgi:hypothetical protein